MSPVEVGPIELQVLAGGLRAICDEMGAVLIRAAHSPNIKERRDCSTALFDVDAELVMQAEHIPVHLGSMPAAVEAIAALAATEGDPGPGDLWILNDPFKGGTHLPDITLISPLLVAGQLIGWAASRAHHADVGGPTPGGMPAGSRRLDEEGVVIEPQRIDEAGLAELAAMMRRPDQRLADLRAQRAANLLGAARIGELADRIGADRLRDGMAAVLDYAERRSRSAIARLADGTYEATDSLEAPDGTAIPLRVSIGIEGEEMHIDFAGSAPQVDGNLNCPMPVTRAAALFAVRVLTDPDAPASAGAFRPVTISAPQGSASSTPGPGLPSSPATSRRRAASPTWCSTALAAVAGRAGAGPGDDEQPDALGPLRAPGGADLLRDDRRRTGSLQRRARPERRPRRDVEHPQHAGRGARSRHAGPGP